MTSCRGNSGSASWSSSRPTRATRVTLSEQLQGPSRFAATADQLQSVRLHQARFGRRENDGRLPFSSDEREGVHVEAQRRRSQLVPVASRRSQPPEIFWRRTYRRHLSHGNNQSNSVVNDMQRSWDHDNLYLVGSGTFPTVATANPTLTIAALCLRTAEKIKSALN